MAKPRTTVDVIPLIDWTNKQLARTDEFATREFKMGCCTVLERVLHSANRYNGWTFNHTDRFCPDNCGRDTMAYWTRTYSY